MPCRRVTKEYDITHGKLFTQACEFDDRSITELERALVALKLLPDSADLSKFYTTAFLPNDHNRH